MIVVPIQDVAFDDRATLAMGIAFDRACDSFRGFGSVDKVRELLAKRIVEAARNGELDPTRLHSQAILGLSIDNVPVPIVSVGRSVTIPVYALVARRV